MALLHQLGAAACVITLACGHAPPEDEPPATSAAQTSPPTRRSGAEVVPPAALEAEEVVPPREPAKKEETAVPPAAPEPPLETRKASRARSVFASPSPDSPRRGRIPVDGVFAVFAKKPGPDCEADWGRVGPGAWACLERSEVVEGEAVQLPVLREDSDLPFVYARHRRHRSEETPPIPVYRNRYRMRRGDPPVGTLPAYGSYAFVERKWNGGEPVLITEEGRAVPARDMVRFRPSEFEGRDLEAAPLAPGTTLAWALYAELELRAEPDESAPIRHRLTRHESLLLDPEPRIVHGHDWYALSKRDTRGIAGWVRGEDVGRFVPEPPTHPRKPGALTVDVDLENQSLSVWRDDRPVFATLISSGRAGDRTPRGLYRIETKWAYGKMESRSDADEPYFVEAVPWAMYFSGRYALHAAYWHDRFGQRMSHGCINLSPRDAKRVFEMITPVLPPGWILVHESPDEPGVVLRIRRGERSLPDRRERFEPAED